MNNITQGLLKAGHKVKVFAISTPKFSIKSHNIPDEYKNNTQFEYVYIDTGVKASKAFLNLFSQKSYNIERFISKEAENKIKEIIASENFDIVQIEGLFMCPYVSTIRSYSKAKIILRAHNVEHLIWQRLATSCKNPVKGAYLKHLAKKLRNYELSAMKEVDGIAAITPVDAKTFQDFGCEVPILSVPVGIDSCKISDKTVEREFPGFFHLGSMDWLPNQEGIKWFLENVWKDFNLKYPQYTFYLAGRNMPEWLNEMSYSGIKIIGAVDNAQEFMRSKTIMIVPLLSGSGIRVKIIEGMACGNAVLTSTVGCEGINIRDGHDIFIANSIEQWLELLVKCSENIDLCNEVGRNAMTLVKKEYDNDAITSNLVAFYNRIIHS